MGKLHSMHKMKPGHKLNSTSVAPGKGLLWDSANRLVIAFSRRPPTATAWGVPKTDKGQNRKGPQLKTAKSPF